MRKIHVEDYIYYAGESLIQLPIGVAKRKLELIKLKQKQKVFNKIFFRNVLLKYDFRVLVTEYEGARYRWNIYQPTLPFGRFLHNSYLVVNQNILRLYTKLRIKMPSWHRMTNYPDGPLIASISPREDTPRRLLPKCAFAHAVALYVIK